MEIFFRIKESVKKIIESLEKNSRLSQGIKVVEIKDHESLNSENRGNYYPVRRWHVTDTGIDCSACVVELIYLNGDIHSLRIRTSWSGWSYEIFASNNSAMARLAKGDTLCKYEGAFRGFLEQKLFPEVTPIIDGDEEVKTSLKYDMSLLEYCKLQKELHTFKTQHECMVNIYPYPRVIYNFLKTRIGNLVFLNGREYGLYDDLAEKPVSKIRDIFSKFKIERILVGGEELTEDSIISEGQKIEVFTEPEPPFRRREY